MTSRVTAAAKEPFCQRTTNQGAIAQNAQTTWLPLTCGFMDGEIFSGFQMEGTAAPFFPLTFQMTFVGHAPKSLRRGYRNSRTSRW